MIYYAKYNILYTEFAGTGQAHLIQTHTELIWSSTLFKVSVKSLPDSYYFMFKMHGQFKHS